jgi:hypothetical protein
MDLVMVPVYGTLAVVLENHSELVSGIFGKFVNHVFGIKKGSDKGGV